MEIGEQKIKRELQSYWKEVLIVGLVLVVVFLWQRQSTLSGRVQLLTHKGDSLFTVARYVHDKNGQLVNQISTNELTIKDLKKLGEQLGIDNVRLKKQTGGLNNLVAYWKGQAQSIASSAVLIAKDTIVDSSTSIFALEDDSTGKSTLKEFPWKNNWMSTLTLYSPSTNEFSTSYIYDIGGFDFTAYRKKQGFLKRKQLVADVRFGDPNMKITQFTGIVVKEEKKKFWETQWFAAVVGFFGGLVILNK